MLKLAQTSIQKQHFKQQHLKQIFTIFEALHFVRCAFC